MNVLRKCGARSIVLALFMLALCTSPAWADSVNLNITNGNCGLSCGTIPANTVLGTVNLTLNASGTITATVLLNPAFTFIVPDGNDINLNGLGAGGTVSISAFDYSNTGAPGTFILPLTYSSINANTNIGAGLGTYAVTIFHVQDSNKPQQPLDYLTFTVSSSTGPYSDANLQNASLAFHLGNCPQPSNGCAATTTGFVGTTALTAVPEPSTAALALLGVGFLAFGNFLRKGWSRVGSH